MLIGSRFKRPKAPIELPGKTYFFVPIDPTNPDSEHVADVTDEEHIQRLMQIPEGYYISKAQALPTASKPAAATPAAATTSEPPAATTTPPPADPPAKTPEELQAEADAAAADAARAAADAQQDTTAPSGLSAELEEAAKNLNALSWQGLNAELKKGGIERAVVNRALEIELAKPDADQRATLIKILKQNLGVA